MSNSSLIKFTEHLFLAFDHFEVICEKTDSGKQFEGGTLNIKGTSVNIFLVLF